MPVWLEDLAAMGIVQKIQREGLAALLRRRAEWYLLRLRVNNPVVGRIVELLGNKVRMDGLVYSVDTPNISRPHKSTIAFGLHEIEERQLVRKWLPRNLPVIELGGGLGVVSCLTNSLMREPDRHLVVEANPHMVPILTRNRDLNRAKFAVVNQAIAHGLENVWLPIDPEFVGSNIAAVGDHAGMVEVKATTLAALADHHQFEQFALIADIEGAEESVILNEFPRMGERIRLAIFEMHPYVLGAPRVDELLKSMEGQGFELVDRMGTGDVFCTVHVRTDPAEPVKRSIARSTPKRLSD